ncbi:hypothetical protein FXF51_00715 [Nonomuraea sp. PA05]|uniref:calcium-binding protein n=1 Tax=Nonomuraea sp. PA05 TaxID=2604466 RepID=UPI0011DA332E|nr:hypothetical protein [Nonomuraea sp. PA05]TYB70997.1 hypothetical protein FXF51_00715 [Nonomuraea sp. PA05]
MRNRIGATRTTGLRALLVGTAMAVPLLAFTGPAHAAGTVSNSNGRLAITSTTTNNAITVSVSGSNFRVSNTLTTLSAGGSCVQVNANTVDCAAFSVSDMTANLSSGTDLLINNTSLPSLVFLSSGGDIFQGGSGQDLVNAGSGNDTLTGNGGNDTLLGGLGSDRATGGAGTDSCTAEVEVTCES